MKKSTLTLLLAFAISLVNAQLTNLAHHTSNANDDGLNCTNGSTSHARAFVLSDFNISNSFEVLEVEFFSRSTAGSFYYYIDIYEKDLTPAFPGGTLNLIASDSIQKTWTNDSLVTVSFQPGSVFMEPGNEYVVVVSTPNVGNGFPVGYNQSGSETAPSYLSGSCVPNFAPISSLLGGNYFLILTVKGQEVTPDFSTRWYFPAAATQLSFQIQNTSMVDYTWTASPSGNSGSGSINFSQFLDFVTIPNLNIEAGDTLDFYMTPDNLRGFSLSSSSNAGNFIDVLNWSNAPFNSMFNMFAGATNLVEFSATDAPNLSNATSMQQAFQSCTNFNGNINNWDVSTITNFRNTFSGCTNFNQPLDNWDVSNATDMYRMFLNATNFNQNINSWNVGNAQDLEGVFLNCSNFNQDLSDWNLESAQNLNGFLDNTIVSPCNLDNMLVSWSAQNLNNGLSVGLFTLYVTDVGEEAKNDIQTNFNWSFFGGTLIEVVVNAQVDCGFMDMGSVEINFGTNTVDNTINITGPVSQNEVDDFYASFSDLPVGNYNYTITTPDACVFKSSTFSIGGADFPSITSINITPVSCTEDSTGAISISASGSGSIYYYWEDSNTNYLDDNTNAIFNLPVGVYKVFLSDDFCESEETIEVALGSVDANIAVNTNNISLTITEGLAPFVIVWSGPDGIINETGTELIGMPNGTYTVTVRDASFCEKMLTATVNVGTGTNIGQLQNTITNVYPNPTTSILNIELENTGSVEIFSITGVKLAELNGANQYQFNTSLLAAGLYFVKAGEHTMKFVKN
jgi:surface protein